MREYDFDVCLESYKQFRNENYAVIKKLNELRKEIRFLMQFDKDSAEQVIQGIYDKNMDLEDTAEVLGIPSWDLYFFLTEKNLLKEKEKKGGVIYEDIGFKGYNLFKE